MCLDHCHPRIGRRAAVAATLGAIAAALVNRRATAAGVPYAGPIFDAHSHLQEGVAPPVDEVIALYTAAGVRSAALFSLPWSLGTAARDTYPERVVPYVAEGYASALHPDSSYVNATGLAQLLDSGVVRGLGEIILRHSAYQLGPSGGYYAAPANNVPADHPALIEAYRVAGRYGVPVSVHQEAVFADELERAVRAAPSTTFIWAHAGHGPAGTARALLARNPNLYADLSARTPWIGSGTVITRPDGSIFPDWAAALTEFADRFMVGLDLFVPTHYRQEYVGQTVEYYRGLLGQLAPDVAARVAHDNAAQLNGATPRVATDAHVGTRGICAGCP
ncbi:MAG: amidohydrolase family protein [Chloroflexota bacterium]